MGPKSKLQFMPKVPQEVIYTVGIWTWAVAKILLSLSIHTSTVRSNYEWILYLILTGFSINCYLVIWCALCLCLLVLMTPIQRRGQLIRH